MQIIKIDLKLSRHNYTYLWNVSFNATSFNIITGLSGIGKTTFLQCIAGLIPKVTGYIQIGSKITTKPNIREINKIMRIGFVFQKGNFFENLSIAENLEIIYFANKKVEKKYNFDEIISLFNIKTILNKKNDYLSGGEQQRAAIAKGFLMQPDLLLLDESLSAIDKMNRKTILKTVEKLQKREKICVLYVTHNIEETKDIENSLYVIEETQQRLITIEKSENL